MGREILYKYIAVKIISYLLFFNIICLIFSELIGISFEQMRFIVAKKISIDTSVYIHAIAAPKFFLLTMPYALYMTNILVYKNISRSSEVVALLSFGISIKRILAPSFIISLLIAFCCFCFQEIVVTESNYITATTLEREMGIDRIFVKNDFVYSQFHESHDVKEINLLLHARKADNKTMKDLILLSFDNQRLQKIITAQDAYWDLDKKIWRLCEVTEEHIHDYEHTAKKSFRTYELKVNRALNQLLSQTRDDNELNIFELKSRLDIFKESGNEKEGSQLEKTIQDRFIYPFSCIIFSLVGAFISISVKPKTNRSEFGVGLIIILIYFVMQFINSSLIGNQIVPVWSGWIPILSGLVFVFFRFTRFH
jgi:lipopolysaccharide export system permease protein